MNIYTFECGPYNTFAYLLVPHDSTKAILIDCPPDIIASISANEYVSYFEIERVLLTHGHWDHVADVPAMQKEYQIPVSIHQKDELYLMEPAAMSMHLPFSIPPSTPDSYLTEGERISIGDSELEVLFLPGHTPGHVAFYHKPSNSLFSGDVLFNGSIGRTDFPGGDYDTLMESITGKLLSLPDNVTVYPGHGPATTIGRERETNPFILDYLAHF